MPKTRQRREVRLLDLASATQPFLFGARPVSDRSSGLGEIAVELRECNAGILFLVGPSERHAEFQQIIGRLSPLWIVFVALGEGAGCFFITPARIVGLAQPVMGTACQAVPGMLSDKRLEGIFGVRIVGPLEEAEGGIVLVRSRAAGQLACRWRPQPPRDRDMGGVGSWLRGAWRRAERSPGGSKSARPARAIRWRYKGRRRHRIGR